MGLSKQQRKTLAKNKAKALGNVDSAIMASGDSIAPSTPQSQGGMDALQFEPESAFKPELLSDENVAKLIATGNGELAIRLRNRWDEIRAVKDRYPVSRGMLERLAHEAMMIATQSSVATRDRLIATKLLLTMASGNHPNKGLPAQVEVNINNNPMDMRRIIDAVLNDDSMGILDTREIKTIPGSENDYAE